MTPRPRLLLLAFCLSFVTALHAQIRHVDINTGSNTLACGTAGSPCQTLQYTVDNIVNSGDTVYIHSGVYSLPATVNSDSAVVELPEATSLYFWGDTAGSGAIIDGTLDRRAFSYLHSTTCVGGHGPDNGVPDTMELAFWNLTIQNGHYLATTCGSTTQSWGGGICVLNDIDGTVTVWVEDCDFLNNHATDPTGPNVGGRSAYGGALLLHGRINTSANNGDSAALFVNRCTFDGNYATQNANGGHGGAINMLEVSAGTVRNSVFCDNYVFGATADNGDLMHDRNAGGAILIHDRSTTGGHQFRIDSCSFMGNSALTNIAATSTFKSEGGAIFLTRGDVLSASSNATVEIGHSFFFDNTIETGIEHIDNNSGTIDTTSVGLNTVYSPGDDFLGPDTVFCEGDSFVFDLSQLGYPATSYLWHDGSTGATYVADSADTVSVQLFFASCSIIDTVVLQTNPKPAVDLGPDTSMCATDSFMLAVSWPQATYLWSTGSTDSSITVNQLGPVWVQIDSAGCLISDTLNVLLGPSLPTNFLGNDTGFCVNDSMLLQAPTAQTYLWQDSSTASSFVATSTGTYWVMLMSDTLCNSIDSIDIQVVPPPTINLQNDTSICSIDNLLLAPASGNVSYLWQDNSTNPTFTVQQAGTYWVEIDSLGCGSSDTIVVGIIPTLPQHFFGNDTTLCTGDSLLLIAPPNIPMYSWQNNDPSDQFTVSQAGTYWVQLSSDSACNTADTIVVSYVALPAVNLGPDVSICPGSAHTLTTGTTAGTNLWQDNSTGNNFTTTLPGTYWVQVNQNGCLASDTVEISLTAAIPNFSLGADTTICSGTQLLVSAPLINNATYLWHDGFGGHFRTFSSPGQASVTISLNGCHSSDTINIAVDPGPGVNLGGNDTLCFGESKLLNATQGTAASYLWQNGSTGSTLTATQTDTYQVTVTQNGCIAVDSAQITFQAIPALDLGNDTILCPNESLVLNSGIPNASHLWQDGSTASTLTAQNAGVYLLSLTLGVCTITDSIRITVPDFPVSPLGADTAICPTDSLRLTFSDPQIGHTWTDLSNTQVYFAKPGVHWIALQQGNCSFIDSLLIQGRAPLLVDLGADTTLCEGESFVLTPNTNQADVTFSWSNQSTAGSQLISAPGTYWLSATDDCGFDTDSLIVTDQNCACLVFVPNAFTPNNNQRNDGFQVYSECVFSEYRLRIFNRWGERIFESRDPEQLWHGQVNGKPAPLGTYTWKLDYTYRVLGSVFEKLEVGRVTVIR